MRVNRERGLKRIVTVCSLIGLVVGMGTATFGGITRLTATREFNHYQQIRQTIDKGDPKFRALPEGAQRLVLVRINNVILSYETDKQWKYYLYGGIAGGLAWFLLWWIWYLIIRWIVKGFRQAQ